MKLYDCPRNSRIRVLKNTIGPPEARSVSYNEVIKFHHIDGMYSYCTDADGQVVHIPAWQEVEVV